MTLVTDEIRSLMGRRSTPITSATPVSAEMLRRFNQGVMESNPVHWDDDVAAASKYGQVVATPLFPMHAFRRGNGEPDPLDMLAEHPDNDGTLGAVGIKGLPPIDLPLPRVLNGGTEAEFFQLAKIGDVITSQTEYLDVTEREGRDGSPMVIVRLATRYTNQDGELLAVITSSMIRR
jgi:acyl dehydratase